MGVAEEKAAAPTMEAVLPSWLRDLPYYFVARAVPALTTLLIPPLLLRSVGADRYADFSIAFATVMIASALSTAWLRQGLLRFHSGKARATVRPSVYMAATLVSASACGVLLFLASWLGFHHVSIGLGAFGLLLAVSISLGASSFFQAALKPKTVAKMATWRAGLTIPAVLIPAAFLPLTVGSALLLCAIPYAVSSLTSASELGRRTAGPEDPGLANVQILWRYGWPLSLWLGLSLTLQAQDRFFLAEFCSAEAGPYAAVADVMQKSFMILTFPLTSALHPRIMNLHTSGDRTGVDRLIKQGLIVVSLIAITVVFASSFWDLQIDRLLVGEGSNLPSSIVPLLLLGAAALEVGNLCHKRLELAERTKTMALIMVGAVVLNASLQYSLTPYYCERAAAMSFAIAALSYAFAAFSVSAWLGQPKPSSARSDL